MTYRLDFDGLVVESFDTTATPKSAPLADPNNPYEPIVWTGCDSACGECGAQPNPGF